MPLGEKSSSIVRLALVLLLALRRLRRIIKNAMAPKTTMAPTPPAMPAINPVLDESSLLGALEAVALGKLDVMLLTPEVVSDVGIAAETDVGSSALEVVGATTTLLLEDEATTAAAVDDGLGAAVVVAAGLGVVVVGSGLAAVVVGFASVVVGLGSVVVALSNLSVVVFSSVFVVSSAAATASPAAALSSAAAALAEGVSTSSAVAAAA